MEGALAGRYSESTVAVYDITRKARESIESVADFANLDIDDLCENVFVSSIVFADLEETRKELAEVIKKLTDGFDSIGEMIQEMEEQIGRDEELERKYNNCAREAAVKRDQADKEFDNLKKELEAKEEELCNEETKIETVKENRDKRFVSGFAVQLAALVVGAPILFVAPPVGAGIVGASIGVGVGNIAVAMKSANEIKIMRDHIDDLKRKVQNKQEAKNEAAREYEKYNNEAYEQREKSNEKRKKIEDFLKCQSQLDKCNRYLLSLQLLLDPIHSSVSVFNDQLKYHQEVGVNAIMKKMTEAAYERFKKSWDEVLEDRVYIFLKYMIDNYMDKDGVMLEIDEVY